MYGKVQASGLTESIPSLCSSAIWGQSFFLVHLAACMPLAPQQLPLGGGSILWIMALGALIHICSQKSLVAVTFLVCWYGRR